jgi:SAM-dependent methyltransferase
MPRAVDTGGEGRSNDRFAIKSSSLRRRNPGRTAGMTSTGLECRVCASTRVQPFIQRGATPVHQNLLCRDQPSAIQIGRGDITMAVCAECGFIFNSAFEVSRLRYGNDYDNNQLSSPSFTSYLEELARYLVDRAGVRNRRIVEVGCGRGDFLRQLIRADNGNVGCGFDPSYTGPASELGGRLSFQPRYFDGPGQGLCADVVICRHVIEHIEQPLDLLRTIRRALGDSRDARVFLETPCVEQILKNRFVWDFFYEHCSLFSAASLATAMQQAGFKVDNIKHVFGGQYLWLEGRPDGSVEREITRDSGELPALARQCGAAEARMIAVWKQRVASLAGKGRVAAWGAGAKGVTFLNLVDPARQWLECVVDLNPNKQGCFVAGTGHPIVSYKELIPLEISTAIVMNHNYLEESRRLLQRAGISVELVSLS